MISLILSLILNNLFPQINSVDLATVKSWEEKNIAQEQKLNERPPIRIQNNSLGIKTTAKSFIILDVETKKVLLENNSNEKLPIASITKLMTALVFLDTNPDWDKEIIMVKEDEREGSRIKIKADDIIKVKDLFYSTLVGSANNAVIALVRSTGLSQNEFVSRMNKKANDLGLVNTFFAEPTGLNPANISSAYDLSKLTLEVLKEDKIREALKLDEYKFKTVNTGISHTIKNTDKLLNSFLEIIGGKTGYIDEAGFNLALEVKGKGKEKIVIVVLGSKSSDDRFQEAKGLANWAFENYKW